MYLDSCLCSSSRLVQRENTIKKKCSQKYNVSATQDLSTHRGELVHQRQANNIERCTMISHRFKRRWFSQHKQALICYMTHCWTRVLLSLILKEIDLVWEDCYPHKSKTSSYRLNVWEEGSMQSVQTLKSTSFSVSCKIVMRSCSIASWLLISRRSHL